MTKSETIAWLILLLIIGVITIWRMRKRIKELEQSSCNYFRFASSENEELIKENFKMVRIHMDQESLIVLLKADNTYLKEQVDFWKKLGKKEAPDG